LTTKASAADAQLPRASAMHTAHPNGPIAFLTHDIARPSSPRRDDQRQLRKGKGFGRHWRNKIDLMQGYNRLFQLKDISKERIHSGEPERHGSAQM